MAKSLISTIEFKSPEASHQGRNHALGKHSHENLDQLVALSIKGQIDCYKIDKVVSIVECPDKEEDQQSKYTNQQAVPMTSRDVSHSQCDKTHDNKFIQSPTVSVKQSCLSLNVDLNPIISSHISEQQKIIDQGMIMNDKQSVQQDNQVKLPGQQQSIEGIAKGSVIASNQAIPAHLIKMHNCKQYISSVKLGHYYTRNGFLLIKKHHNINDEQVLGDLTVESE